MKPNDVKYILKSLLISGSLLAPTTSFANFFEEVLMKKITNEQLQFELRNLEDLRHNISSLYFNDVTYKGLSNEIVIKARAVRQGMFNPETKELFNAYKEPLYISTEGKIENRFAITTTGIPEDGCKVIVSKFLKEATDIKVNDRSNASVKDLCAQDKNKIKLTFM